MTRLRLFVYTVSSFLFLSVCSFGHCEISEVQIDRSRAETPEIRSASDALAHYVAGMILDNFGSTEAAVKEYKDALRYKQDTADIYLKLGADLLFLGKIDEASATLNKAAELDPKNIKSYMLLAVIYASQGKFPEAQAQYEKALEADPGNLKVLTFLSDLFVLQQKLDKAAEVYEKILTLKKDDAFIYYNLGIIYSKLSLYDKAEENLQKAIETDSDYLEAQLVLGYVYEIDGKYGEAAEQYKKVIALDSLNREAHLRLGQLYYRLGDIDGATEQNRILMTLDVSSPEPYLRNFTIYITERDFDKAEGVLTEAIRKGISDGVIYASLGYLATQRGEFKNAIENYTVAVEKDPKNQVYRFYRAVAYDRAGYRKKALKQLEDQVEAGNALPEAYNYLGYMYVEAGQNLDKAVSLIQHAVIMDPSNGAYIDSLGWAYYKQGKLDEALRMIERARELDPDDAAIREHLGDIYFEKDDIEKALEEWNKALELDPAEKRLLDKIKRARAKLKRKR